MQRIIHLISVIIIALCALPANAQSSKSDSVPVRKPSAWKLISPLGLHERADFDTLPYNYQRQAIPSLVSDAYATTGNLGADGQNQIFFERHDRMPFLFLDALRPWLPTFDKQKFYNVYVPFTQLSYNMGGGKRNSQDRLRVDFAGNVNRRVGVGAKLDYLYSKGAYEAQATKDFIFGFSGYYKGDRYELQAFYNHWNLLNKENGGITNALYITDPAELQGGVSHIDAKSIPVNLSAAHSRVNGQQLYINQAYNVGFWREEEVNDTLTREVYVPVTKFIWTLDYESGHHIFLNDNASQGDQFWTNRYLQPQNTRDDTRFSSLTNTLGISMIEGFQKWAKFGLAAYAQYSLRTYKQPGIDLLKQEDFPSDLLTPLPAGFAIKPKDTQHLLWAGAQLTKQQGAILTYNADFKIGLSGDVAADIELLGNASTHIPLPGDTVAVDVNAHFKNLSQPYLLKHYISNHFAWNNDFGKTRSFRAGGAITVPWTNTRVEAGFENLQNYVYFNNEGLPAQYGGSVQIFTARLNQLLKLGILHWDNTLTLQTTSKDNILPLPLFTVYSNLYIHFRAFSVLDVQLGIDCDYYTRYYAPAYQPATMSFHTQQDVKLGNYAFMNLYASCKLYKTRFFVMLSHINQGWFSKDYFSSPLYPLNPRKFQIGLSVDFAN
ncbi:MAG: putative porin [Prevotella sp.]|nr:putative porin [Prevotella sp.]MCM1074403.1 putative porin [Ruminococcus sp.]